MSMSVKMDDLNIDDLFPEITYYYVKSALH